MTEAIVAFLGISGVGKSTFLRHAATLLSFQHLTAGYLIGQARDAQIAHDHLRLQNIADNQNLLIKGFQVLKDANASFVVLDGHAIIDSPAGLEVIDADVFRQLGVQAVAHLEAEPEQILANREGDGARARPSRSVDELRDHQTLSLARAREIATELTLPFMRFRSDGGRKFALFLQELVSGTTPTAR